MKWDKSQPLIPNSELTSDFAEEFLLRHLSQLNNVKNGNGHILDLVLTNRESQFSTVVKAQHFLKASTIHHHPITMVFNFETFLKEKKQSYLRVRKFNCENASSKLIETTYSTLPLKTGVFQFSLKEMATITNTLRDIAIAATTSKKLKISKWAAAHPWLNRLTISNYYKHTDFIIRNLKRIHQPNSAKRKS